MEKLKKSFDYKLLDLSYIKDGEPVKAKKITIKAPTYKEFKWAMIIEQEYRKAEINIAKNFTEMLGVEKFDELQQENQRKTKTKKDNENESNLTAEQTMQNLMSGNANMSACFECLKSILLNNQGFNLNAKIDDIVDLNDTIYEDLSYDDLKNILGEYILNFFVISRSV